jgi:hypothetical protein
MTIDPFLAALYFQNSGKRSENPIEPFLVFIGIMLPEYAGYSQQELLKIATQPSAGTIQRCAAIMLAVTDDKLTIVPDPEQSKGLTRKQIQRLTQDLGKNHINNVRAKLDSLKGTRNALLQAVAEGAEQTCKDFAKSNGLRRDEKKPRADNRGEIAPESELAGLSRGAARKVLRARLAGNISRPRPAWHAPGD